MPPSPQLVDDYWVGLNQVELNPTLPLTSFVSSVVTAWECLLSKMGRKFMWRHTGVPLAFLSFLLFIFRLNKKIKNWYILPNFGYSVFHICSLFPVEQAVVNFCCWWCINLRLWKFGLSVMSGDGKANVMIILTLLFF